jgi:hypothetical protein
MSQEEKTNRRDDGYRMTDENFRRYTLDTFMSIQNSLENGRIMMTNLDEKIDAHFKIQSMDISEIKDQVKINTDITKKTAEDTAGIVSMYNTGKKAANTVTTGTKKLSKFSKVMMPIFAFFAAIGMIFSGHWPTWAEIVKAIK